MKTVVVLDNLRSVYNVGSIFRTANAVGVCKIYLCGTTPTPVDKKGDRRKDFAKVALGAEDTVEWEYVENTLECVLKLKKENYFIVALEQDEKSVDYKNVNVDDKERVAFVVGAEVVGVAKGVLAESDVVAEIPMLGTKESLNVTIAFGVAVYRVLGV
ncbi:MAG: tRNA/rRNA methyltransferase (SpoU) [Parcubacteria group bacterium GW2011_GWC1_42_11]|uniref:tRNA/rRNA methyltransferase (SpoU) n=1 Tax=Candidatus Nomurabacteria bacterium GW2011_GWC2_42_20 TaxID=1618756 RepID=A0A0G1CFR6_9BACT|nr:MAG: tRNA/rRNA methyltransferase (SpoU) [Parcubacteria group bacterium GW2011_GWC1_42_11]KKS48423.1 MAG: tRNA/rRNA methyltransferase (SpoU) [Candidatus Nomurabacteria bacterium GW2011_GWC2_42_20]KKS59422.1 MAG: tRNA/rRNA methyltransferase (SpoU) [Candidatus Nomurabacteria bacterium GW2011_GWA2_42_41]KKT09997.1 MAG: tRNA/rRNA methyltransferase (SpoU) [Candidatus Nomurabacteria bacterium GW2011_GWB1_43_20]TAN35852.1 MAG: TrmH family RNA methyltransferase [Patescibacteria group bacterium]HBH71